MTTTSHGHHWVFRFGRPLALNLAPGAARKRSGSFLESNNKPLGGNGDPRPTNLEKATFYVILKSQKENYCFLFVFEMPVTFLCLCFRIVVFVVTFILRGLICFCLLLLYAFKLSLKTFSDSGDILGQIRFLDVFNVFVLKSSNKS